MRWYNEISLWKKLHSICTCISSYYKTVYHVDKVRGQEYKCSKIKKSIPTLSFFTMLFRPKKISSTQMKDRHVTVYYHRQPICERLTDCSNSGTSASFKVGAGKLQMFLFTQSKRREERLLMGFSTEVSRLNHNYSDGPQLFLQAKKTRNKASVNHEWRWWLCTVQDRWDEQRPPCPRLSNLVSQTHTHTHTHHTHTPTRRSCTMVKTTICTPAHLG